jgi:hypothetical protein
MRKNLFAGWTIATVLALGIAPSIARADPISWDQSNYPVAKTGDFEWIVFDDFIILNNPWGKGSVKKYREMIFKANADSAAPFGWKWDWPVERTDDVKAYQCLSYGWNPWMADRTNKVLPVAIGNIAELSVSYDVAMSASGKYNLSFDFWITEYPGNTDPLELNVKREFMVWIDRKDSGIDQYWYVGPVIIDGDYYEFYRLKDLKGTLSSRDFMIFIKKVPIRSGKLDITKFLEYLLKKKYVKEGEFFKNIDFGNEVWHGEGETVVNEFSVTLETK